MSKKANTTIIGAFVIGAAALVVAGLLIFGSGKFFTEKKNFVLFFDESVKGLSIGAPVDFKGVRVGSVTDVKVVLGKELGLSIPVYIELDPDRMTTSEPRAEIEEYARKEGAKTLMDLLVEKGLRGQLALQSLVTGQLGVHLDFFPDTPIRLVHAEKTVPEIPTIGSSLANLSKTLENVPVEEIANKALVTLDGIEKLVNSPDTKEILVGVNRSVKEIQALVESVNDNVQPLASNANKAIDDTRALLKDVDGSIKPLASNLTQTAKDADVLMRSLNARVPDLIARVDATLKAASDAIQQVDKGVDGIAGPRSAVRLELIRALSDFADAARSLRLLADYVERHPEALIRGKKDYTGK